jgi:hypothetical protein
VNEEVWGVLFENSDVEYIIAAFESEQEAEVSMPRNSTRSA